MTQFSQSYQLIEAAFRSAVRTPQKKAYLSLSNIARLYCFCFVVALAAPAATFHVETTGNNSNDGSSVLLAKLTLDAALSIGTLAPGDTIILGAGVFSGDANTDVSGSAGNLITVQGAGVGQTFMVGRITVDQSHYTFKDYSHSGFRPFVLNDAADFTTIRNVAFSETGPAIEFGGADNCLITECTFARWKANGAVNFSGENNIIELCSFNDGYHGADVIRANGAINCIIRLCLFTNLQSPNNNVGTSTETVTTGTGTKTFNIQPGLGFVVGDYIEARNSASDSNRMSGSVTSYDNVTGAFEMQSTSVAGGSGLTFSSWLIRWVNEGNHCDIVQAFGPSSSYENLFEKNRIENSPYQFGNFEQFGNPDVRDWTFRNNVFYLSRIQTNIYAPGFKFYNNTIYGASGTTGFRGVSADKGNGIPVLVYNNIFSRVGAYNESPGPYSGATADYNLITDYADDSAKTGYSEANGINGGYTPYQIFTDPDNGDLTLKAGSPAIGAGTDLTSEGFSDDHNSEARVTWEIGAYAHEEVPVYFILDDLEYPDNSTATSAGGWANTGTPVWGYTTAPAPLTGFTSSLQLNASSDSVSLDLPSAQSEVWIYLMFQQTGTSNAGLSVSIRDSVNSEIAYGNVLPNGIVRSGSGGGGTSNSATGEIVANTTYHYWVHFIKGTGANAVCAVYRSTDGIKPVTPSANRNGGTTTADMTRLVLRSTGSTVSVVNKVRMSTTEIGDNPL